MSNWLYEPFFEDCYVWEDRLVKFLILGGTVILPFVFFIFVFVFEKILKVIMGLFDMINKRFNFISDSFFEYKWNFAQKIVVDSKVSYGQYIVLFTAIFWVVMSAFMAYGDSINKEISINPFHEYLLLKYGKTTIAEGVDEGYCKKQYRYNGVHPLHNFFYQFDLPSGKVINRTIKRNEHKWQDEPLEQKYYTILYLPQSPNINEIKSSVSDSIFQILRHRILPFILQFLLLTFIPFAFMGQWILDYRKNK